MIGALSQSKFASGCELRRLGNVQAHLLPRLCSSARPLVRAQQRLRRQHPAAAQARAGLSTYRFPRQPSTLNEWFSLAVRDIVKHVDRTPFLQLVQLGGVAPKFTTLPVPDAVVPVPELWQGIAEHMSQGSHPDVVILVQHISPTQAGPARQATPAADEVAAWAAVAGQPTQSGDYCEAPAMPSTATQGAATAAAGGKGGVTERVEAACRRLVQSGVGESMLNGKVGDCCDGPAGHRHAHGSSGSVPTQQQQQDPSRSALVPAAATAAQQQQPGSGVVPFLAAAAPRRRAVHVAALAGTRADDCSSSICYYGVVVQSRHPRIGGEGVDGCYLLKTVKMTLPTGCACTHYSLTRLAQGEHLEKQFVQSWLQ